MHATGECLDVQRLCEVAVDPVADATEPHQVVPARRCLAAVHASILSGARLVEQFGGGLADLPVAVGRRPAQGRLHPWVVEAGQRDRGAATHGGSVIQRNEHRGQSGWVPDRTEGGDGSLPAARVGVFGRGARQCRRGGHVPALAEEPGGADDDERIGVPQCVGEQRGQRRPRTAPAHPGRRLHRPPAHDVGTALDGGGHVRGREGTEPGQRAHRRHLHGGVRIVQAGTRRHEVAAMPGERDTPASRLGAPVPGRFRGNIVAHRSSMSDPDATADGEAAAIPSPLAAGDAASADRPDAQAAVASPPQRSGRRRRIWPWVVGGLVVVVIAAGLTASRISVNYYVLTPGDATPVARYIEVPPADNHPLTGTILLTDVFVTQLNALSYLRYKYFDSNSEVISSPELLGPTPNESQYLTQGYLQMTQAQSFATAAALRQLGYTVTATNAGALVYGIEPGSPAAKTLKVAQVITAVNATPTPTDCALVDSLRGVTPGTTLTLSVEQSSVNDVGDFVSGPVVQTHVTVGTPPKSLVETGCGPPFKATAYLGIDPQTQQDWHFPVAVTVHTQDIGGPSAGLAMALGIIDKLSSGRLTGKRIIAATGTIDQNGNVGDVGGVAEKTVAVERAGATVFFVPSVELKTAESKASPSLHVYGVTNLDQVLGILRRLGGNVPRASTSNTVSVQAAP